MPHHSYSQALRKRFVRDFSLPIQLLQEPHFSYFLELYDPYYGSQEKAALWVETVEALGGEDAFFREYKRVRSEVIETIEAQPAYQTLSKDRLDAYKVQSPLKQELIYHQGNAGGVFISLDLKKANFHAFQYHDPTLVLEAPTYDALIQRFVQHPYFWRSKYLRQVIFGNLQPKKQQKIQKYLIHQLHERLLTEGFAKERFVSASSDELILKADETTLQDELASIQEVLPWPFVRVEAFRLAQIGDRSFFLKESLLDESIEWKAIPGHLLAQCIRHYRGEACTEMDRSFSFEGLLAAFLEPIFPQP